MPTRRGRDESGLMASLSSEQGLNGLGLDEVEAVGQGNLNPLGGSYFEFKFCLCWGFADALVGSSDTSKPQQSPVLDLQTLNLLTPVSA